MKKANWKKGLFSSTYRLFDTNIEVGEFSPSMFGGTSLGEINEVKFKFINKGNFISKTEINNLNTNQLIGNINLNFWSGKTEIKIHNKKYFWKFDNLWLSKCSISENGQQVLNYKMSTQTRGNIESSIENDVLLLSGLYVFKMHLNLSMLFGVLIGLFTSGLFTSIL